MTVSTVPAAETAPAASFAAHLGATLRLGLPLVGAQLAQIAMNVTDTLVAGRLGAAELAAAVLATQCFFLVWIFGSGFAQAMVPLAAAAFGRGDAVELRRAVRMGFWVLFLYGAAMCVPLWHLEPILLLLGQEPETARLAGVFMRVFEWALVPALLAAGARSALSVLSRTGLVLAVSIGGAVLNAALAGGLAFGWLGLPRLGFEGAALGSVLANLAVVAAMLGACAFLPDVAAYRFFHRLWRPDWPAFRAVLRLGWPISATIVAEGGLFAAASIAMGWFGAVALAAHGIALQLASVAFMVPLGLAQAAAVRVGVARGRGDWPGVGRAGFAAIALALIAGTTTALLFWTMPATLVGLYLDPAAPAAAAVLATGTQLLAVAAAFQMVDCLQAVSSGTLRGLADTRVPMLVALLSYWGVGMPVALFCAFPLGLGGFGIWIGLASGLLVAAVLMTGRFGRRVRFGLTPA